MFGRRQGSPVGEEGMSEVLAMLPERGGLWEIRPQFSDF